MSSVTQRIKEVKWPKGYISTKDFKIIELENNIELNENENISPAIIGIVVDYMTRFVLGDSIKEAFKISIKGAYCAAELGNKKSIRQIKQYLKYIDGLDDISIQNACKVVAFDVWYRNPIGAIFSNNSYEINPNIVTINNIRILIERSLIFFEKYGPIIADGFDFYPNGYSEKITSGDGDFLTKNTLWDFKVSKNEPIKNHLFQLLIYYVMGKHSGNSIFDSIDSVGIFNPRLNKIYLLNIDNNWKIAFLIDFIEKWIICY